MLGVDRKPRQRFSLLLLEEGEHYFDDCSAVHYPPQSSEKRKGRLKICSRSLVFEPEDLKLPVTKFPYKDITALKEVRRNENELFSLAAETNLLSLTTKSIVETLENDIISPYRFKKDEGEHKFEILYVALDGILRRVSHLHGLAQAPSRDSASAEVKISEMLSRMQAATTFDMSWLEDLDETITYNAACMRVSALVSNPGRVVITQKRLYIQEANNISPEMVKKLRLSQVSHVMPRRYLLRHVGIEIFFGFEPSQRSQSIFLSFDSKVERDRVREALFMVLQGFHGDDPSRFIFHDVDTAMRMWQQRELSTYDYLMFLNSKAGRSFNDLTQYPVFPWIFIDYESPVLDLTNPEIYRDLSKPVGALNEKRLDMFRERYREMPDDPMMPKFMYGSHYSTPGYVLHYLVRKYPQYMLKLQSGRFDAPDRLFHSISESWHSVTNHTADVKELIPEFFEDGSFLENNLGLDLGMKQNGIRVDNVVLPSWAKDVTEFIEIHKRGLESEHVSLHIHNWIDLIFGYKQNGQEAVKADNLFYYLTYEGAVDIEKVSDRVEKMAIERQIAEFGQSPSQLFSTPHPQRNSLRGSAGLNAAAVTSVPHESESQSNTPFHSVPGSPEPTVSGALVEPSEPDSKGPPDAVWPDLSLCKFTGSGKCHKDAIFSICTSEDGQMAFSAGQDSTLKMISIDENKQLRSFGVGDLSLSCVIMGDSDRTALLGSWDNNIYVFSIDYGRALQVVPAHDDAVSSLCLRSDTILSSSWDSTVKIWKWQASEASVSKLPVAELTEHFSSVVSLDYCSDRMTGLSGDEDGMVVVWDVENHSASRTIESAHDESVTGLKFINNGSCFVSCSKDECINVFDRRTGSREMSFNSSESLSCIEANGDQLLSGGSRGLPRLWDLRTRTEVDAFDYADAGKFGEITSLHVSHSDKRSPRICCGTKEGYTVFFQYETA